MSPGWFRDTPRDADDLCPNCCTPWKCNGPHLDENQVTKLRAEALGAIRDALVIARSHDTTAEYLESINAASWHIDVETASAQAIRSAIRAVIKSDKA